MNISSKLTKRIISSLLIAPAFVYSIIIGGITLKVWLFIAFLLSVYEWYGLAKQIKKPIVIMVMGFSYITISYSSFIVLRYTYSINVLLLFLGIIWFSDIGAYFIGKICGGPKLIKQVSPNKTWSGFGGAVLFPALFAFFWVLFTEPEALLITHIWYINCFIALILGGIVGVIGQTGDLLISFIKRQAKVKDTGSLIPGHGGLLDRIDSMLLGAPIFLILIIFLSSIF